MDIFGVNRSPLEKFLQTNNLSYLYQNTTFDWVILIAYFSVLSILAAYGLHRYHLVYLYFKYRDNQPKPKGELKELPKVTVQLPIFNELYVVQRLIDSVCQINYPRHLMEVQVLDDSTDETRELAQKIVRKYAARGHNIHYLRRPRPGRL